MNRKFVTLATLGSIVLLSACSSPKPVPEETVLAPSCCNTIDELPFYQITSAEFKQVFEIAPNTSPVYQFASGSSPFQAVELPAHVGKLSIKVSSILENQVFLPYISVLDANFREIQTIDANSLELRYGKIGAKVYKETSFEVSTNPYDASAARFLVMYTKPEQIGQYTEFKSAETLRAEEQGLAKPIASDPKLPNGYYGSIELKLEPLTFGAITKQQREAGPVQTAPKATVVTPTVAVGSATLAKKKTPMLAESEEFYNQLIENFVKSGELDKALKLVEEAEYAGSNTARATFINAVKNLK